jgi:hypothetical protein
MAGRTVHLHGNHISSPQGHEQLDKYRPPIIAYKTYISLTSPLPQETLDRWVLFRSHEHMDASAICAQQSTGQFPVTQVGCRSDKPPGVLQHRLQMRQTLHLGHVRLLQW